MNHLEAFMLSAVPLKPKLRSYLAHALFPFSDYLTLPHSAEFAIPTFATNLGVNENSLRAALDVVNYGVMYRNATLGGGTIYQVAPSEVQTISLRDLETPAGYVHLQLKYANPSAALSLPSQMQETLGMSHETSDMAIPLSTSVALPPKTPLPPPHFNSGKGDPPGNLVAAALAFLALASNTSPSASFPSAGTSGTPPSALFASTTTYDTPPSATFQF
eukprot:gene21995-29054_t